VPEKGGRRWLDAIRSSKDPTVFTVLFENTAALLGLFIAAAGIAAGQMFNLPVADGMASVVIGLLLGAAALISVSWAVESTRAGLATFAYTVTIVAMFAVSGTYHRIHWKSETARTWMKRVDHSMIFVLIAGSYTPFGLLVLHGALGEAMMFAAWSAALVGVMFKLVWIDAPGWLGAATYIAIGWIAVVALPELVDRLGIVAVGALGLGGVLYSTGAVIHARKRPDPVPTVFGYHELFHLLVILAAAVQYAVVAFWVL